MSCLVIEDLLGFRHLEWLRVHDFGHTKSYFVVLLRVLGRFLEGNLLALLRVLFLGRLLHCQQQRQKREHSRDHFELEIMNSA